MEWNRSETIALASPKCAICGGLGSRSKPKEEYEPCACVLRAIFRACHQRFRECIAESAEISRVSLEHGVTREAASGWGRKNEEYVADYLLVAKRTLTPAEHQLFRYHFLLGADWRLCCRKLNVEKGNFFHAVYRIQRKLGRTFRELEPYSLFPLRDYFTSHMMDRAHAKVVEIRRPGSRLSSAVPLKKTA